MNPHPEVQSHDFLIFCGENGGTEVAESASRQQLQKLPEKYNMSTKTVNKPHNCVECIDHSIFNVFSTLKRDISACMQLILV